LVARYLRSYAEARGLEPPRESDPGDFCNGTTVSSKRECLPMAEKFKVTSFIDCTGFKGF